MLPDFLLSIELRPGDRRSLLARDVPACVFWQGYPELDEGMPQLEFRRREADFFEHLLERVVVKPRLTLEGVRSMGVDSQGPTRRYLEAVGYSPRALPEPVQPALLLALADPLLEAPPPRHELEAFGAWQPPRGIALLFKALAETVHQPASVFWAMPISEMLFNYSIHLAEQKAALPLPTPVFPRPRLVHSA